MRARRVSGFVFLGLLCLLLAVRWMLAEAWPSTQSSRASLGLSAASAAALCFLVDALRQRYCSAAELNRVEHRLVVPTVAGMLLFAGLNAGAAAGTVRLKGTDLLLALALTPVVIAVTLAVRGTTGDGLSGADLLPGLMAPAGLLLILPQPAFGSLGAVLVLLATPVGAGLGAAWLAPYGTQGLRTRLAGCALSGAALCFGMLSFLPPRSRFSVENLPAVALDAAVLLLIVESLMRLGARRFSALFAAVPLLLLLEGLVLERVHPTWEQAGGLGLLLAATVLLLRGTPAAERLHRAGSLT